MKVNPHSTFVDATGQWLSPVQLSASGLLRFSTTRPILEALITILNQLEPDPYIAFMLRYYQAGLEKYGEHWSYADQLTVLHAAASLLQPENYLEIGVFRGRSMSVVASVAPNCRLWGFDSWVENYADLANPGPDFVRSQLKHVGYAKPVQLTSGNSLVTVPDFLKAHPDLYFDLITVDGDHSREGAVRDLQNVMPRLKIGGVLVFDDISHPLHPYLEQAWDETVAANSNFITAKFTEVGHGVALAIRRSEGSASVPLIEQTRQWNANEAELVSLRQQLEFSERDRADRLNVIQRQSEQFGQLQHEQFALHQQLNQTESERNALRLQLTDLQYRYEAAEADRATRLEVIHRQATEIGHLRYHWHQLTSQPSLRILRRLKLIKIAGVDPQPQNHAPSAQINRLGVQPVTSVPTEVTTAEPQKSTLDQYIETINAFNRTRPDMVDVRAYNHQMLDIFNGLRPLAGKRLLDVGASPHGYALEHALPIGVSEYVGIGLGISIHQRVRFGDRLGQLLGMNAEALKFESNTFDLITSLSTFEHFFNGAQALREMHRVLKPGGSALISFQPIWTASNGHHLHHVPEVARLIPPWAHLLWSEDDMRRAYAGRWPAEAPMSLEAVIEWIYRSKEMNRVDILTLRNMFYASEFEIEWLTPLPDDDKADKRGIAKYLSQILPYSADDLLTKGFSLLLNKKLS